MRSSFVATTGLKLARTPSVREQAARRRVAVIAAVVGLAAVSGVVGAVTAPHGSQQATARTGPFSYFPTE
jgi:hypothetical protein